MVPLFKEDPNPIAKNSDALLLIADIVVPTDISSIPFEKWLMVEPLILPVDNLVMCGWGAEVRAALIAVIDRLVEDILSEGGLNCLNLCATISQLMFGVDSSVSEVIKQLVDVKPSLAPLTRSAMEVMQSADESTEFPLDRTFETLGDVLKTLSIAGPLAVDSLRSGELETPKLANEELTMVMRVYVHASNIAGALAAVMELYGNPRAPAACINMEKGLQEDLVKSLTYIHDRALMIRTDPQSPTLSSMMTTTSLIHPLLAMSAWCDAVLDRGLQRLKFSFLMILMDRIKAKRDFVVKIMPAYEAYCNSESFLPAMAKTHLLAWKQREVFSTSALEMKTLSDAFV